MLVSRNIMVDFNYSMGLMDGVISRIEHNFIHRCVVVRFNMEATKDWPDEKIHEAIGYAVLKAEREKQFLDLHDRLHAIYQHAPTHEVIHEERKTI